MDAFGACLYLLTINSQGIRNFKLICVKSRISPLKSIYLPRLELCGAVLLARVASKIIPKLRMKIDRCVFWTDSTVTLAWISSPSAQWKTFVAHRVGEIQELMSISEWAHISTRDNPADVISRGREPGEMMGERIWWKGPPGLSLGP